MMPRRNRRLGGERTPLGPPPDAAAPSWAEISGHQVRRVVAAKAYVCPGCEHAVRIGVRHLVVVPSDDPDSRRHWHTECWRRELRRTGRG
jgi:hypothetical protein